MKVGPGGCSVALESRRDRARGRRWSVPSRPGRCATSRSRVSPTPGSSRCTGSGTRSRPSSWRRTTAPSGATAGQNGLTESEGILGSSWPQSEGILSCLVPPERIATYLSTAPAFRQRGGSRRARRWFGPSALTPVATFERLWGTDPWTQGYVTHWRPGDVHRRRSAARHPRAAVLRLRLRPVGRGLHGGSGAHRSRRRARSTGPRMSEIAVLDPATARQIGTIEDMDEAAVDVAVARGARGVRRAAAGGRGTPDDERGPGARPRRASCVRAQRRRAGARLETPDVGKPLAEAEWDVAEAARILEYYAGWPTKAAGESHSVSATALSVVLHEPVGVVAAITPWNYPLLLAVQKVAPGARGRLLRGPEARRADAAHRAAAARAAPRGRAARRCLPAWSPAAPGRATRWSPTRASTRCRSRVVGGGPAGAAQRRRLHQAGQRRAGRQVAQHRLPRRRPAGGDRRHRGRGVRQPGPDLLVRLPRLRPRRRLRRRDRRASATWPRHSGWDQGSTRRPRWDRWSAVPSSTGCRTYIRLGAKEGTVAASGTLPSDPSLAERLLRRAHRPRGPAHCRRRARGDLRTGHVGHPLHRHRRGGQARQRQPVRSRRRLWTSDLSRALSTARGSGPAWSGSTTPRSHRSRRRGEASSRVGIGRELGAHGLHDYVETKHLYLNHAV